MAIYNLFKYGKIIDFLVGIGIFALKMFAM